MASLFESTVCGRCGGSGHHSYCTTYGTTCFGCGGSGRKLTKRGQVAQSLYNALASRPADQIVPGDVIWVTDGVIGKSSWQTVLQSSRPDTTGGYVSPDGGVYQALNAWYISTEKVGQYISRDALQRVRQSREQRAALQDVCIAYQRSLNQQGKPDKTLAKITHEVAWG